MAKKSQLDRRDILRTLTKTLNATNDQKLIAFQFKIIHNVINNNANLYKWKIKGTNLCSFCDAERPDDVVHEFTTCSWTRRVVAEVARDLGLTDKFRHITKKDLIFGVEEPGLNNILLISKLVIHTTRHNKSVFNVEILKKEIYKRIISDEKTLNANKFKSKWLRYNTLITDAKAFKESLY